MLSPGKIRQGLAGRLLLSTALVAVSLAYGWWQRHHAAGPAMATAPMPVPPAANRPVPPRGGSATTVRAEPTATQATGNISIMASRRGTSRQTAAAPSQPPAAPISALATLEMYQPPPLQAPLPLVTGTPAPGVTAPIPPGTHLEDGDYLSDAEQYEWGVLQVKISVHGGQIAGLQVVHYPDHRSESLQLSLMASPILDSEVIKTQQSKVDVVSSATDTSYVFRDAIASAIAKATRW